MNKKLDVIVMGETSNPRHIIVLLHGMTGDYEEMSRIMGTEFAKKIPDALILIPNAPLSIPLSSEEVTNIKKTRPGFQEDKARTWWLPIKPKVMLPLYFRFNMVAAFDRLNEFIDDNLQKYGLKDEDLGIYGFSQGGTLAINSALKRNKPCAAVVCHSGAFPGFIKLRSRPDNVLLITGTDDIKQMSGAPRFLSFLFSHANTMRRLKNKDIKTSEFVYPGYGHSMNNAEINVITTQFVADAFCAKLKNVKPPEV